MRGTYADVVRGHLRSTRSPDGPGRHVCVDSIPGQPGPFALELDRLLGLDEVAGHELVYGELLIGDRGGRTKLLAAYERMHQASTVAHREVIVFVRDRGLYGRGVGWIDMHLLASALVGRMRLWTIDPRFAAVAQEVGVAYEIPT